MSARADLDVFLELGIDEDALLRQIRKAGMNISEVLLLEDQIERARQTQVELQAGADRMAGYRTRVADRDLLTFTQGQPSSDRQRGYAKVAMLTQSGMEISADIKHICGKLDRRIEGLQSRLDLLGEAGLDKLKKVSDENITSFLVRRELQRQGKKPIDYYGAMICYKWGVLELAPEGRSTQDPIVQHFYRRATRFGNLLANIV